MSNTSKASIFFLIILVVLGWVYYVPLKEWFSRLNPKASSEAVERLFSTDMSPVEDEEDNTKKALNVLAIGSAASVSTTTVRMIGCVPNPESVKVRYGEVLSFLNDGDSEVGLYFGRVGDLTVSPGGVLSVRTIDLVSADRKLGNLSLVGYSCRGRQGPAGFVMITD